VSSGNCGWGDSARGAGTASGADEGDEAGGATLGTNDAGEAGEVEGIASSSEAGTHAGRYFQTYQPEAATSTAKSRIKAGQDDRCRAGL
jgi:hypothetical protein